MIAKGQFLGTENRIVEVWKVRKGWRCKDWTGAVYKQEAFPDGLRTWPERPARYDFERPLTPWPD